MTAPRSTQAAASARKVSVMPRPSRGYSPSGGWPIIGIIPLFVPDDVAWLARVAAGADVRAFDVRAEHVHMRLGREGERSGSSGLGLGGHIKR